MLLIYIYMANYSLPICGLAKKYRHELCCLFYPAKSNYWFNRIQHTRACTNTHTQRNFNPETAWFPPSSQLNQYLHLDLSYTLEHILILKIDNIFIQSNNHIIGYTHSLDVSKPNLQHVQHVRLTIPSIELLVSSTSDQ